MRSKKAIINIFGSVFLQVVSAICGFIVPRLIISTYGSEINGVMNSIIYFLSYITLLDAGIGTVARTALYKPLAQNNYNQISGVVVSVKKFFRNVCFIFIGYTVLVAIFYPKIVNVDYDWVFISTMVLIISYATIIEHYVGLPYQVMLQADQKRYVGAIAQGISLIVNAAAVVIVIKLGAGVHVMKLVSSTIFLLRPLIIYLYVKKNYPLNPKAAPTKDALKNKWDGIGHHIAMFLHNNTDVVILTLFSKISKAVEIAEVSVYSIYYSIIYGIGKLSLIIHQAVEAAFGNMIAKNEKKELKYNFRLYEQISFLITTFVFTCTGILVIPFMKIYMANITDADYIRPAFAYTLTLAQAMYFIRMPYNNVTLAAGHYRQTRNGAFFETFLNIAFSIVFVIKFGITGVAMGTLIAMTFRTIQYARYMYKNILEEKNALNFVFRFLVSAVSALGTIICAYFIPSGFVNSYLTWVIYAVIVAVICLIWVVGLNFLFYRKDMQNIKNLVKKILKNFNKNKT